MLDKNEIRVLRELASQCRLPPIDYPMQRLSDDDWEQAVADSSWYATSLDGATRLGLEYYPQHDRAEHYSTVMDHHRAYIDKRSTPSAVIRLAIAKVKEWELAGFPIFSSINVSDVTKQAEESDARYDLGKQLSVFDGVPIAFEEAIQIYGHIGFDGKNPHRNWEIGGIEDEDVFVTHFRELGAIIFGSTIMTEGGVSPLGYNANYQGPFNPFSLKHFSGGSSGGAAVAVSSGIVPVSIGLDTLGSVRIPAAWTGLHGLAPTFGRVPVGEKSQSSMLKIGPLANTALDAGLAYAIMSSKPSDKSLFYGRLYDGGVRGVPPVHMKGILDTDNLSGIRIGVYPEWCYEADPEVQEIFKIALQFYTKRGAEIVDIDIPNLRWQSLAYGIKLLTEFTLEWELLHHSRKADLDAFNG